MYEENNWLQIYVGARNNVPALREFLAELKAKGKVRFRDVIVIDRGPTCMLKLLVCF